MNPWRPVPLLRLVIPFICGIVSGQLINCDLPDFPFNIILIAAWLALILIHWVRLRYGLRWMAGIIILIAFYVTGFQLANIRSSADKDHFPGFEKAAALLIRICECPVVKQGSTQAYADIISEYSNGCWKTLNTKLYLRVFGFSSNKQLLYGNFYIVHGRPEKIMFFTHSHSFNFRKYLSDKGVRYELSCRITDVAAVPGSRSKGISRLAFEARDRLLQIFRDKGLAGQEFSVAAALLLGYVNEIDSRLKSAFAASGTMHILSVSGMHVGIIFLFLETVLSFMTKFRYGIYLKLLIQIIFIWMYAAVTGFSPAVLRAAACLSFLIAGKVIRRKPEMLNVISASLFLLLLMAPSVLSDVGFQLSYLAVIGIVILYKPIYDLYVTRYWLPDKIWALVAVSIAAQIATSPLSLYYFHRFPNYFILSNLIIVPFSNGIIMMGILGLLLSGLPFIGNLTISALKLLLCWLNKSVLWIGSLPGAVSTGFFPDIAEVCLFYLLIMSVFVFLVHKQPRFLLLAFSCLILLEVSEITEKINLSGQCRLAIHQGKEGYVIRFVRGRKEICFYSCLRMTKDSYVADQIGNERQADRVELVQKRTVNFRGFQRRAGFPETGRFGNMIIIKGRKIYILDSPLNRNLKIKTHADILLITGRSVNRIEQLKSIFSPEIILNLSTAHHSKVLSWSDQARQIGLCFFDLKTTGFYQEEL